MLMFVITFLNTLGVERTFVRMPVMLIMFASVSDSVLYACANTEVQINLKKFSTFNCQWEFINCVKFLNNFFRWTLQIKLYGTTNLKSVFYPSIFISAGARAHAKT